MTQLQHVIRFTDEDIRRAHDFARKKAPYAYNRGGVEANEEVRRWFVGKLGEIAFARLLNQKNKHIAGNESMFAVWEDVYAADRQDFLTSESQTIDIKTASRDFHRRITIPEQQFHDHPSDFYVGIRIAEDFQSGTVVGYASHSRVQQLGIFRGPDPARNYNYASQDIDLAQLLPIQELLDLIRDDGEASAGER